MCHRLFLNLVKYLYSHFHWKKQLVANNHSSVGILETDRFQTQLSINYIHGASRSAFEMRIASQRSVNLVYQKFNAEYEHNELCKQNIALLIERNNGYEQLNELTKSSAFIREQIEKDVLIVNHYLEEANQFKARAKGYARLLQPVIFFAFILFLMIKN